MQAIVAQSGSQRPCLMQVALPDDLPADAVLCRTLELGICGTDREILHSAAPLTPPGDNYLVLGHECLGRVIAIGSQVRGLAVGDLVVPAVRRGLGVQRHHPRVDLLPLDQYIERGIVRAHGFSAPQWLDWPEHLFRVKPELAPWAVLAEPFSVAEKAINEVLVLQQARLEKEAPQHTSPRVLVTGLGPIGFAAAAVAVCRGWQTAVWGRDEPDTFRARQVVELGARYLRGTAVWEPDHVERDGFDLILECTGAEEVVLSAARSLATCGAMVWLGSSRTPRPQSLNVAQLVRDGLLRNHLHLGSVNAAPRDFQSALAHLDQLRRERRPWLDRLITARVGLDQAVAHYEHREPQGIKTVIVYDPA